MGDLWVVVVIAYGLFGRFTGVLCCLLVLSWWKFAFFIVDFVVFVWLGFLVGVWRLCGLMIGLMAGV